MSTPISSNYGWGMEESLDVEWAHAIAPDATILLVEAASASTSNLLSAVSYAVSQNPVAVSMSWGTNDFSGEQTYDHYFTSTSGVSFYASAGDTGGVVTWPSASANVISVGGTTLTQTTTGYTESAWSSGGGGTSAFEPASTYQAQALGISMRETPDVAYNADPNTGFLVYDTYVYSGWYSVGGTSAGAPQWAAIQTLGLTATAQNFYKDYTQPTTYAKDFTDITTGSNGHSAAVGYDLATGLGSPLTTNFQSTTTPDFSLSATPVTIQTSTSLTGTSTITATSINNYIGTIGLSVTNEPTGWAVPSFSSNTISGGSGTSILTITAPSTSISGTYSLTIQGTDGTISHTVTVPVTVTAPDFSLSSSPSALTIPAGSFSESTTTATSINNYGGTLNLGLLGTAATWSTISASISVTPSAPGTSTLTVKVPAGTASGTYSVTVTATDSLNSLLTHSTTVSVTVTNPDFSISASPSSLSIRSGSSGTAKITITAIGGFNSLVSLSASSSGGGLTTTLSPSSISGSGSSTLTINVPSTTRSGTFTVTITGISGALTHTTTVTVTVSRFF